MPTPGNYRTGPTPPIGVLAKTEAIANSIVRELGMAGALSFGLRSRPRCSLSGLVVDADIWPLHPEQVSRYAPCLAHSKGYVFCLSRYEST